MKRSALFSCVCILATALTLVCLGCQSAPTAENSIDDDAEMHGDQRQRAHRARKMRPPTSRAPRMRPTRACLR